MLNKDIHNGLEKKEIRDFLAQFGRKESFQGRAGEIESLEKELERIKERLIHCKNHQAIVTLIELNGWQEFDTDKLVPYNRETYFPFIGTDEEFRKLQDKIKKEQENKKSEQNG